MILQRKGPLTCEVQVGHRQVKVNVDHLLPSKASRQFSRGDDSDFLDYSTGCEQEAPLKKMFWMVHLKKFQTNTVILKGNGQHQKDFISKC